MISDVVSIIANLALALSFIVALVFGIAQVKAVERDRRERLTLETLRNFQSRDFAELLQFIISANFPKDEKELNALPKEQQVMYVQFSQQMESLGILVAENFIDLDLLDKTLGSLIVTTWEKYKIMFFTVRGRDPFLGEYFQWLAERIDQRMKSNPRKPFYENHKV